MDRFGPQFKYLHGKHDLNILFPDEAPTTSTPWGQATRSTKRHDYEKQKVLDAIKSPSMQDVDPRDLKATQGQITRAGVKHYMENPGKVYADQHLAGNEHPVVYRRDDGTNLLLSGHHRAAAAMLQGRQFQANVVEGGWGHER